MKGYNNNNSNNNNNNNNNNNKTINKISLKLGSEFCFQKRRSFLDLYESGFGTRELISTLKNVLNIA